MSSLHMTYVMLRLNRWARYVRWVRGEGVSDPRPSRVCSWMGKLVSGRVQQTGESSRAYSELCPVDVDEAVETQSCVDALPEWARRTVVVGYLIGGTDAQQGVSLGITDRSVRYRRGVVHTHLLELFNLAAAGLPLELAVKPFGRPAVVVAEKA